MARGTFKFRQRDLTRAVRAVQAAGIEIGRVEIAPDGTITIRPGKPDESTGSTTIRNEWDDVA
jgi:hypothetical protein